MRISVTLSDELDKDARKLVSSDRFRFSSVPQLITHACRRYLDEEATRRSYVVHGMALSLSGKTVEVDEATLRKMKKALDIEDESPQEARTQKKLRRLKESNDLGERIRLLKENNVDFYTPNMYLAYSFEEEYNKRIEKVAQIVEGLEQIVVNPQSSEDPQKLLDKATEVVRQLGCCQHGLDNVNRYGRYDPNKEAREDMLALLTAFNEYFKPKVK